MKYYIKRLNSQELGSVDESGKPKRGRYLYIAKSPDVLSMFPPLSETSLNDFASLPIVPLRDTDGIIYCTFTYHNSRFHGGDSTGGRGRDEYRIYLSQELEGGQNILQTGDILIFREGERLLSTDATGSTEPETQRIFYMKRLAATDPDHPLFTQCTGILKQKGSNANHAVFDGTFAEIEEDIKKFLSVSPDSVTALIPQQTITQTSASTDTKKIADLISSPVMFRDWVLTGYNRLCAVTQTALSGGGFVNLEAAHIKPHSHNGSYLPSNGIALSRDFHWAFDKGLFTLTDELKIMVHTDAEGDLLRNYDGKKIYVPDDPFFQPALDSIKYHRENVYGLFKKTGTLAL